MSNIIAPPQFTVEHPQPLAVEEGYQRGFDDPTAEQHLLEAHAETAGAADELPAVNSAELQPDQGLRNEQSSRWGSLVENYRYKGVHRAHRDDPSSHERSQLTPGDLDLKAVLQEVREAAYTEGLERAAADGAGEKAAEVRARSAAQAAVQEYYDSVQSHRGVHRASTQARLSGTHARQTATDKAVKWLTYPPEEIDARARAKRDAYDQKNQVEVMASSTGAEIPMTVRTARSLITPGRAELRYRNAVGALDGGEFETGTAAVSAEARTLKLPAAATVEEQDADLILSGARTESEVFNELYGERVVGGSTVYGGRLLAEGKGLRRKLGEAGRISTTNQDDVGPVERANAKRYAERMALVASLEGQVTDKFVPSKEVIEAMLYGDDTDPATLTEGQQLVVKTLEGRLFDLREQKLLPGETVDARVKLDHSRPMREMWRDTKEALKGAKAKMQRAVGIVALHGAVWTDAARAVIQPEYVPQPTRKHDIKRHRESIWSDRSDMVPSSVEPIRIYSPGELAGLASTWTFVRAQMIAGGTARMARDWFRPRDIETEERKVSALRLAGAAAAMLVAATASYGYYKVNGDSMDLEPLRASFSDNPGHR